MPIDAQQWRVRVGLSYGHATCIPQLHPSQARETSHIHQQWVITVTLLLALSLAVTPLLLIATGDAPQMSSKISKRGMHVHN